MRCRAEKAISVNPPVRVTSRADRELANVHVGEGSHNRMPGGESRA
jgi:hypothetical protein